nr:3-hydroxyacyl-CoA dehydrogenase [Micromonospora sp. DSM 115978]
GLTNALLHILLDTQQRTPSAALELAMVDGLAATAEEMFAEARAWIAANPQPKQPWDAPTFRIPGGTPATPAFAANLPAFPANLRKQLKGSPLLGPRNILAAAVEGASVDVDTAFKIETDYLVELICGQVSTNIIKTM